MENTANSQKLSDEMLIQKALQESSFFGEIIRRYENKLMAFIRGFSGLSKEDAEDVLQDTFINTYKNLSDFDPSLRFSSWIYRIARNTTIDFLRKRRVRPVISFSNESFDLEKIIIDVDLGKETDRKILASDIQNILIGLPAKYQEVVLLYYLEQKTYEEISDILRRPKSTIGTLLNRAKKHLKKHLQKYEPDL